MPYAASVAPDLPAQQCSMARSYIVRHLVTQAFVVSRTDMLESYLTAQPGLEIRWPHIV
ncbi:hypothetical protein DPMN_110935 [Dreissena polymorpha]|uniref:Uncharacterized protein n=1 Tax=Dreissena polymorpha TaxID=45954 RepID=A0A9D4QPA8_DREPO|nr:hypothetical protein DPMN_110935 [Dreissena polymorpha]